jgi:hypothetical protein
VTSLLKGNCKSDYGIEQSLKYSIKIMGDHVKPKSMCCSSKSDFKSLVIKHAERNNNQDLVWKFCVLGTDCTVLEKTKGLRIQEENSNQKGSSIG